MSTQAVALYSGVQTRSNAVAQGAAYSLRGILKYGSDLSHFCTTLRSFGLDGSPGIGFYSLPAGELIGNRRCDERISEQATAPYERLFDLTGPWCV